MSDLMNSPQFRHNAKTEKWQEELLTEQHGDIRDMLEIMTFLLAETRLMNARFEEAFRTGINIR